MTFPETWRVPQWTHWPLGLATQLFCFFWRVKSDQFCLVCWWHFRFWFVDLPSNKPRIRNFPRISNKESETKTRESETKIRESETKIPRIRNQKPRESETKIQESDTTPRKSEAKNQKLKIANQTPRSANQKPNKATNQKPKKANLKPNPPPPLAFALNDISIYPHKRSSPAPDHYVEWDITFNLSS